MRTNLVRSHVWTVGREAALPWRVEDAPLAPAEWARASRYGADDLRLAFIRRRGFARLLLGAYLGSGAEDVDLVDDPSGKPVVRMSSTPHDVYISISHVGSVALIATAGRPVGVDLERTRQELPLGALAADYLHPLERAALAASEPLRRAELFTTLWTRKEACVKVHGEGMAAGLERICVLGEGTVRVAEPGSTRRTAWLVRDVQADESFRAAVAVDARAAGREPPLPDVRLPGLTVQVVTFG